MQIPARRLETAMQLEADRFARNQWDDDEFRREIEVIKEERRQRTEEAATRAHVRGAQRHDLPGQSLPPP